MSTSKLMKVTYYDPKSQIRLLCYADTVVWDTKPTPTLTALRFGGYPERVQGLADAIYGGATIEIEDGKDTYSLKTLTRQYRRELSHDGVYAEATVSAESACGRSSAPVKALVLNAPKQPFYYNSRKLLEYLRLEKEKITLEFDKFGLLVVRSGSTRYVQSPMRAPVQAAETGKAA